MNRSTLVRGGVVLVLFAATVLLGGAVLLAPEQRRTSLGGHDPLAAGPSSPLVLADGPMAVIEVPPDEPQAEEERVDAAGADVAAADEADAEQTDGEDDLSETTRIRVLHGGQPVVGARVRVYRPRQIGGRPLAEGRTDGSGSLDLGREGTEADLVHVVEAPGFERGLRRADSWPPEVELERGRAVPGLVLGPEGEGVAAQVRLLSGAILLSAAQADGEGMFSIDLPDTRADHLLSLEVSAPGYYPLRLQGDIEANLTDLRLRRGDTGRVEGVVVDAHGQPLVEVLVRALTSERAAAAAETNVDGQFALEGLRPGTVDLEVYLAEQVPVALATVSVAADETTAARVVVSEQGTLRVTVEEGQLPLEGAQVSVVDPTTTRFGGFSASGAQQSRATDSDGLVWFGLPVGRYYVRVRHQGREGSAEVTVEAGEITTSQVDLSQARSLTVRVVDGSGDPVPGVFMDVSMPSIQWQGMPSGTTGADGAVHFESLPLGLAGVHLGKGDQWRMVYTEAEEGVLVWTEVSQLTLLGSVSGAEGRVLLASVLPDTVKMEPADVYQGILEAQLTPPDGERQIYLLASDASLAPVRLGQVALGEPELVGFEANFAAAGVVRGRMRQAGVGVGVPGEVRVEGALGGVLEARAQWLGGTDHDPWITVNEWGQSSGADGSFELGGLPAGTHTLTFRGVGCDELSLQVTLAEGQAFDLGDVGLAPR